MKTIYVALAASMLLAAFPLATAGDCLTAPPREGLQHPLDSSRYFFVDPAQPEKIGEWVDENGMSGLQTTACFTFGVFRYGADTQAKLLA